VEFAMLVISDRAPLITSLLIAALHSRHKAERAASVLGANPSMSSSKDLGNIPMSSRWDIS